MKTGWTAAQQADLQADILADLPGKPVKNSQGPYYCPWCGTKFMVSLKCFKHARKCDRNPKNRRQELPVCAH